MVLCCYYEKQFWSGKMTIFDSIKYPIIDSYDRDGYNALPREIRDYWTGIYNSYDLNERVKVLRIIIAEYQTEDCRITGGRFNDNI